MKRIIYFFVIAYSLASCEANDLSYLEDYKASSEQEVVINEYYASNFSAFDRTSLTLEHGQISEKNEPIKNGPMDFPEADNHDTLTNTMYLSEGIYIPEENGNFSLEDIDQLVEEHAQKGHPYSNVYKTISSAHFQHKPALIKDPELLYVHTILGTDHIDSLNEIHQLFPTGTYNDLSISYFQPLAEQLCGKAFLAEHSQEIVPIVASILNSRLSPNTDIVLLIDKTGSMEDDIYSVKQGLAVIKDILSSYEGIKVSVASYSDKNYHGDLWFNSSPLTDDLEVIQEFIDGYSIIPNPDTPESVNDAIVRVTSELNWTPGNQRLMLVIGDAPSQEKPLSEYSMEEVVKHCAAMDVTFNLYPVIINMSSYTPVNKAHQKIEVSLYPNPSSEYLNISLIEAKYYQYQIFDQNGKRIMAASNSGEQLHTIYTSELPNGVYFLHIYDNDLTNESMIKFVVQH
ncbi:MAG: T9SS type A sorting domain-containing protein [Flavobacteriales bacterium]|nr:T9SS type A sorting domain-containing protein [Flavobacteriales bacterium]MCB9196364.1 T9SS type A sorting domain-containing protein [Flavobacteriales bacterium]MCB9198553.1 T9SS type A sorting domain-containing protein [Flavobacteriales bacterium]